MSPSQAESPDERSGERSGSADGPELARNRSSDKDTRIDGSVPWLKLLDPVGWTGLGLMFIGLVLLIVAGVLFLPLTPPQATLLAGFGVVLAALLTFYNGHLTRISTEQTAAREIAQAQAEAAEQSTRADNQLKEQQLQWNETHRQELIRDLRSRYTIAASQLGDGSPAIRLAGVYALISLGDDWRAFGNEAELNVCIDLSLAYLRTAQAHTDSLAHEGASTQGAPSAHQGPSTTGRGEPEVRKTILYTFLRRMYTYDEKDARYWGEFVSGLGGSDLTNLDLWEGNLSSANLTDVNLRGANLAESHLMGTHFGYSNLTGANLFGADLTNASFKRTNLTKANLTGAILTKAYFVETNLSGADLSGSNLMDADFPSFGVVYYDQTKWPTGFSPPPDWVDTSQEVKQ